MGKFDSVDAVRDKREELNEEYDSGLPDYLRDYFDDEERKRLRDEFFRNKAITKNSHTLKERSDFLKKKSEEFWEDNKLEIVKSKKQSMKYGIVKEEPPIANERLEQEELDPEEIKVLISISEDDLYLYAVRYFPHYLRKPSSKLHKFLYNTLSRELSSKSLSREGRKGFKWATAAPRGNSKSSLVSNITPLWCICYEKKKFIIIISDTAGQSEDFLADIKRELLTNSILQRDFPHVCGKKGPVWRQDEIITNNGIRIIALGTGSKVRGRKYGIHRPDLILLDDLENSDMVRSKKEREFIRYNWFDKDLLFAGAEGTDFFVVGTVIGKDSLLNALLDGNEYPGWKTRRFSAVENFSTSNLWMDWAQIYKDRLNLNREEDARKFFEEHEEEMLEGTKVLWPEGDPYYGLMEYYYSNPSGFFAEKQNSPYDPSKVYVTKDELTFGYFHRGKYKECIDRGMSKRLVYGALDPSLGKKSTKGDYSCITTLVRDPTTGLIFVVDINIKRRSVDDQIELILKSHDKYHYRLFGVETNAFQYVVADNLRKLSRKLGIYVPIEEINNYHDKKMRIEGIVPFLKDGTIIFDKAKYDTNQMYNLGVEQLLTFTGEDDQHDDAPDSIEMAFSLAKKTKFRRITNSKK